MTEPALLDPTDPAEPTEPTDPPRGKDLARQRLSEAETRATTAEGQRDTAHDLLIASWAQGPDLLAVGTDLVRFVDRSELLGDDGQPDPQLVRTSAQELLTDRADLGHATAPRARQVGAGQGQGAATVDLAGMLRAAAGETS